MGAVQGASTAQPVRSAGCNRSFPACPAVASAVARRLLHPLRLEEAAAARCCGTSLRCGWRCCTPAVPDRAHGLPHAGGRWYGLPPRKLQRWNPRAGRPVARVPSLSRATDSSDIAEWAATPRRLCCRLLSQCTSSVPWPRPHRPLRLGLSVQFTALLHAAWKQPVRYLVPGRPAPRPGSSCGRAPWARVEDGDLSSTAGIRAGACRPLGRRLPTPASTRRSPAFVTCRYPCTPARSHCRAPSPTFLPPAPTPLSPTIVPSSPTCSICSSPRSGSGSRVAVITKSLQQGRLYKRRGHIFSHLTPIPPTRRACIVTKVDAIQGLQVRVSCVPSSIVVTHLRGENITSSCRLRAAFGTFCCSARRTLRRRRCWEARPLFLPGALSHKQM